MNSDIGEATKGLENELWPVAYLEIGSMGVWPMGGSPADVGEVCDVGEATEGLENELCRR